MKVREMRCAWAFARWAQVASNVVRHHHHDHVAGQRQFGRRRRNSKTGARRLCPGHPGDIAVPIRLCSGHPGDIVVPIRLCSGHPGDIVVPLRLRLCLRHPSDIAVSLTDQTLRTSLFMRGWIFLASNTANLDDEARRPRSGRFSDRGKVLRRATGSPTVQRIAHSHHASRSRCMADRASFFTPRAKRHRGESSPRAL